MRRVASAFSIALSIGAFTAVPAAAGCYYGECNGSGYYNTSGPGSGYPPPAQYVAPPSQGTTTYYEQGPAYTTTRGYASGPAYAPPPPAYYPQQPTAEVRVYSGAPVQTYSGPPVVRSSYVPGPSYSYGPSYSSRPYHDRPYYGSHYAYYKPYRPRTVYSGGALLQTGDAPNCGQRTYVPYGWTWIRGRDYRC